MHTLKQIPGALQQAPRWLHWRYQDGAKVPFSPRTGRPINANNTGSWMSFNRASSYLVKDGGLGFGLKWQDQGQNFAVIDLDDCLDEFGTPNRQAQDILTLVDSYTEVSPSGYGLKIFCRIDEPIKTTRDDGLEVLATGYATVTGLHLLDYGANDLHERTLEVQELVSSIRFNQVLLDDHTPARITDVTPAGTRNVSLFRHACSLRSADGLSEGEIIQELETINAAYCDPPKSWNELQTIARSACRYPAGDK